MNNSKNRPLHFVHSFANMKQVIRRLVIDRFDSLTAYLKEKDNMAKQRAASRRLATEAVAALVSLNLCAADWVRSGMTLTEIVTGSGTPWELTVSASGTNLTVTAVKTAGSGTELDFTGAITDDGGSRCAIVSLGGFKGNTAITSVVLPSGLTTLSSESFRNCTALGSVVLPDSLNDLRGNNFNGCSSLTNIVPFLPASLKRIGLNAFRGCSSLALPLVLRGTNDVEVAESKDGNLSFSGTLIPSATIDAPMTDAGTYFLNGASQLGEVILPPTLRRIRARTFGFCPALTNVVFRGDCPEILSPSAFHNATQYGPRIFVPRFNETWEEFMRTNVNFTAMNTSLETTYRNKYPVGYLPCGMLNFVSTSTNKRYVWISDRQYEGGNALYVAGVPTRIGMVDPPYGLVTNLATGSSLVCTAPANAFFNGTRYACYGSVLDTEVSERVFSTPVTNAGTTRVVPQTGSEVQRLVWLWGPDGFTLDTSAAGLNCGTVVCDPANTGPYPSNTVVALAVTPNPGYRFVGWTGDVEGGFSSNAAISVTMDSGKACHPVYAGPWTYNGSNQITDGNWVLTVGRAAGTDELSVTAVVSVEDETVLHLGLEVTDGNGVPYHIVSVGGFQNRAGLRFVYLPESLRTLAKQSFYSCQDLERVEPLLPASLTEIGSCAFSLCLNLGGDVVFPANTIATPSTSTTATRGWFNSTRITSCDMSAATMESIVNGSFDGCTLLRRAWLPQGVATIGNNAFRECSSLELVSPFLPDTVTHIGYSAFFNCTSLEGDLLLEGGALTIATYTSVPARGPFAATAITSARITAPIEAVNPYFFNGCPRLASVQFPDTVASLGTYSLGNCPSLTEIVLPRALDGIAQYTFRGSTVLTNIYFKGSVPMTRDANAFWGQRDNQVRVFVPRDDPSWTQDFYNANVTPMDAALTESYRSIFPEGRLAKGRFTWKYPMWFCTWDPRGSRTIILLR